MLPVNGITQMRRDTRSDHLRPAYRLLSGWSAAVACPERRGDHGKRTVTPGPATDQAKLMGALAVYMRTDRTELVENTPVRHYADILNDPLSAPVIYPIKGL